MTDQIILCRLKRIDEDEGETTLHNKTNFIQLFYLGGCLFVNPFPPRYIGEKVY